MQSRHAPSATPSERPIVAGFVGASHIEGKNREGLKIAVRWAGCDGPGRADRSRFRCRRMDGGRAIADQGELRRLRWSPSGGQFDKLGST